MERDTGFWVMDKKGNDLGLKRRVYFIFLIFLFFFFLVPFRAKMTNLNREPAILKGRFIVEPRRGNIYDSNGILIAGTEPVYDVYLDVDYLLKLTSNGELNLKVELEKLREKFKIDMEEERIIKNGHRRIITLRRGITQLNFSPEEFPYLSVRKRYRRVYPFGDLVKQIVGKTSWDGAPLSGIEKSYDSVLSAGSEGVIEYDRRGIYRILGGILRFRHKSDGKDLKLNLDLKLQRIVKEELERTVKEEKAKGGMVVIMESKTGRIRAMYSTYGWNTVVMSYFEPGSMMKPITYSIAKQNNLIFEDDEFHCDGRIKPVEDVNVVIRDTQSHGDLKLPDAFAHSCNVATVIIARRMNEILGRYGIYKFLRRFGFGSKTGIDLPGEISGVLKKPNEWSRIDFAEIAIGQGIGTTPIQLITAVNAIVNDGILVAPRLVGKAEVERRVISVETARFVKKLMRKVVTDGTGKKANSNLVEIAGKTGTAQKAIPGEGYIEGKFYSSFIGFFPYDDPKYTMLVIIDEPSNGKYYGGDVAAPLFRRIVERMVKDEKSSSNHVIRVYPWKMPDLSGLSVKDALEILQHLGFRRDEIEIEGEGLIVKQIPPPNTCLKDVKKVILFLSFEDFSSVE